MNLIIITQSTNYNFIYILSERRKKILNIKKFSLIITFAAVDDDCDDDDDFVAVKSLASCHFYLDIDQNLVCRCHRDSEVGCSLDFECIFVDKVEKC